MDYNLLDSHNFEFSMKLCNLGWKSMTMMRDDVYPDLVAHLYANTTRKYNNVSIDRYFKGVSFMLDRFVVRKILGIGLGGEM